MRKGVKQYSVPNCLFTASPYLGGGGVPVGNGGTCPEDWQPITGLVLINPLREFTLLK